MNITFFAAAQSCSRTNRASWICGIGTADAFPGANTGQRSSGIVNKIQQAARSGQGLGFSAAAISASTSSRR